jgi:hypothetical protein
MKKSLILIAVIFATMAISKHVFSDWDNFKRGLFGKAEVHSPRSSDKPEKQ